MATDVLACGSAAATQRSGSAAASNAARMAGQVVAGLLGGLPVALGGRLDAQRPEQFGRGRPRVAGLAQDRVQALPSASWLNTRLTMLHGL